MKLHKRSIRWKITLSNMMLLSVVSLLLYIGANRSADRAMESIPMTQIAAQGSQATGGLHDDSTVAVPLQAAKKTHRVEMGFYMIATILLGGLMTSLISKRALKSLEAFAGGMKETELQKLAEKIVIPHAEPEVACLVDAFNEMTEKLAQSLVMQKQFSHSVAHELRTPLTVIRTKIEVFQKKKDRSAGEYDALLTLMQRYTQSLSAMVEDLLQYSNLAELSLEDDIPLDELLSQVMAELRALYPGNPLSLESGNLYCKGNGALLHRVFSNIMENACRYSGACGSVRVCVTKGDAAIAIQISDHGIGIADDDKAHLFEPFFRVDKSRSRAFGGVGLGLFFCKEIVTGHGGTISVSDNHPCGSVVTVTLPA